MTQSNSTIDKDLSYLLDLVRELRAKAETARHEAGADDASFYQFAGEGMAYARIEGAIEGILTCNEIFTK